jgi:hypothetical protein
MNDSFSILSVALVILIGVILAAWFLRRAWTRNRLRGPARERVAKAWKKVLEQRDGHRQIMEADSVLDAALRELGYKGTMGEKLKKAGRYLPDTDAIWRAHKLRNRIAHEVGIVVHPQEALKALHAFERAIQRLSE